MTKRQKLAGLLLGMALLGMPLASTLSQRADSKAYTVAGEVTDSKGLRIGGAAIGTGAGVALAFGVICPPQFAAFAVVAL